MSKNIVLKIEEILEMFAEDYRPPETMTKAVIHQWIHAIINDETLFAERRGIKKSEIIDILKKNGIYKSFKKFKIDVLNTINIKPPAKSVFSFIDLFAGIGGMRQGFEQVGGNCVFSSEFEPKAQMTYEQNYGEYPFGDITLIPESDIPDHDVLLAGFPCQPFSHAGLKLGIDDTRGTLFYDIARIIKEKKPKIALLENVRGLMSHDNGYTLQLILKALTRIGYKCIIDENTIQNGTPAMIKEFAKKMVLKSKDFGVPQNRQRIYMVFWRKDIDFDFKYPKPMKTILKVGDILEKNPDAKYTISDRLWAGHQRRKVNNKKNGKGFGYSIVTSDSEYTNTISARYYKDGSEVLIKQIDKNPRKLTPREAARLQGFPEEFTLNESNVQAYKQFGNSVSIPVIKAIAKEIALNLR
jgi:DNA (cytosine-5)-methyltransferase 1